MNEIQRKENQKIRDGKLSNKERIQNMNTRDLAEFLVRRGNICFKMCEDMTGDKYRCPFLDKEGYSVHTCVRCYTKWLESESDIE